jgi:hypothetical protein
MTQKLTPAQERYRAYLQSEHWHRLRLRIIARANEHCEWCHRFCGRCPHDPHEPCGDDTCEWCRLYFDEEGYPIDREHQTLEIHHKTYERVGAERDDDLVALCWTCHDGVTDRMIELQRLYKAGVIERSEATPHVAATKFGETFWRGVARLRQIAPWTKKDR